MADPQTSTFNLTRDQQAAQLLIEDQSNKVAFQLCLASALLTCLGGLVIASGTDNETIPTIAIFFSIFGLVFVDWLCLFELPPIIAYAGMGLASFYCVSDFVDWDAPGNHQMIAVARLLVCVQAILMLQRKNRRIFEQLGVFCLLELVVAAVFNNAINFGILLIPIGIIGGWALSLLTVARATEQLDGNALLIGDDGRIDSHGDKSQASSNDRLNPSSMPLQIHSLDSTVSVLEAGMLVPRFAIFALTPAIILVAIFFFYAIPRTTDAARVLSRGDAVVGFSNKVRLEQFGKMGQSSAVAARVQFRRISTDKLYRPIGGIYLRGAVLESYQFLDRASGPTSLWSATGRKQFDGLTKLPTEFIAYDESNEDVSDALRVEVSCEASQSASLFSVAPYYQIPNRGDQVNESLLHDDQRWTISRPKNDWLYPRIEYSFGTHAFRGGVQGESIASGIAWELNDIEESNLSLETHPNFGDGGVPADLETKPDLIRRRAKIQRRWSVYAREILRFDRDEMPTIQRIANQVAGSLNSSTRNDMNIAKALEHYFVSDPTYQYTLNLDAKMVKGVDPIEQFVATNRRGHCQFFASGLAMMLRSQHIPSRVVVGYRTDEFSDIGEHHVVRQSHAHAWVEALIDRKHIGQQRIATGQPASDQYWVRLDPTPESRDMQSETSSVNQALDLAQTMWDDYVIDMDSSKQTSVLIGRGQGGILGQEYSGLVDRVGLAISRLRAGELGGGSLARNDLFSWPAALLGIGFALATVVLVRLRPPQWIRRRLAANDNDEVSRPGIEFYAKTLDLLGSIGVQRHPWQTPGELLALPETEPVQRPLKLLTIAFYRLRFGPSNVGIDEDPTIEDESGIVPNVSEKAEINAALTDLADGIDRMTIMKL